MRAVNFHEGPHCPICGATVIPAIDPDTLNHEPVHRICLSIIYANQIGAAEARNDRLAADAGLNPSQP